MNPQTRQQIDSLLGWIGYSLSYTEQNGSTVLGGGALADVRARQYSSGDDASERRTAGSAGDRPDARVVVRQMLEAFAEGLLVCARLAARLALATYRYASERLEDLRDPDRTSQGGPYGDTRPTLRTRMDAGLERALDALESRVRTLSPMPALRRARAAFVAKADAGLERLLDRLDALDGRVRALSPMPALRRPLRVRGQDGRSRYSNRPYLVAGE